MVGCGLLPSQAWNHTEPGPADSFREQVWCSWTAKHLINELVGIVVGRQSSDGDFYQLCVCACVSVWPNHRILLSFSPCCSIGVLTGAASQQQCKQFKVKVFQHNET